LTQSVPTVFKYLDLLTPARDASYAAHRRIFISVGIGAAVSVALWSVLFPDTFWFLRLWVGFATGAFVGLAFGSFWQLHLPARRMQTSADLLRTAFPAFGLFSLVAIFLFVPDLRAQEKELALFHSLSTQPIVSVTVAVPGRGERPIKSGLDLSEFMALTRNAQLFYPSHEGSILDFQLTLRFQDGTYRVFEARVPERHVADVAVRFHGYMAYNEILLPDARAWINKVTQ
jgi:hypothetical protein